MLVAAKEGNEEIMTVLIDHHARLDIFDEVSQCLINSSRNVHLPEKEAVSTLKVNGLR